MIKNRETALVAVVIGSYFHNSVMLEQIELQYNVNRFDSSNEHPVKLENLCIWNVLTMYLELKTSILLAINLQHVMLIYFYENKADHSYFVVVKAKGD